MLYSLVKDMICGMCNFKVAGLGCCKELKVFVLKKEYLKKVEIHISASELSKHMA